MILEAHASLEAFLRSRALGSAPVRIAFDVPTRPWSAAVKEPTVNCFLYDVRENQSVKHAGSQPLRDDTGRVVGYRPVPRYMDHCYLVSAWAPTVQVQHKVLGAVLGALLRTDTLPRELLRGALAEQPRHVVLSVAQGNKRGMLLSLGGEQRLALELELAVPWPAGDDERVEGHVEQAPRIHLRDKDPREVPVRRRTTVVPLQPTPAGTAVNTAAAERTADQTGDAAGAPAAAAPAPSAPAAPTPPSPAAAASGMLSTLAVRMHAQLQAARQTPPEGAPPAAVPTAKAAAQLGAQVGVRVVAVAHAAAVGAPSPQPPPDTLQAQAARAGAAVGAELHARLLSAVSRSGPDSPDGSGGDALTPQQAGQLGARAGVALAARVTRLLGPAPAEAGAPVPAGP